MEECKCKKLIILKLGEGDLEIWEFVVGDGELLDNFGLGVDKLILLI